MDDTTRALLAQVQRLGQLLAGERSLSAARLRTIRHQREVIDDLRAQLYQDSPAITDASAVAIAAWQKGEVKA